MRDVVRDVVAEVKPSESRLVAGLARFDDATVVRRLKRRSRWWLRSRAVPLRFDLHEVEVLVVPVVWLAVDQAAQQIGTLAANGATSGTKALVRKVFHRKTAPVTILRLTDEQRAEVRRLVLEMAVRRGVDEDLAEALADAVYVRLALAEQSGDAPDSDGSTGDVADGQS